MNRDTASLQRLLKIKTNAVVRLGKELKYYMKEQQDYESKLMQLREEQADALQIKKTEEFVEESSNAVRDTHSRLFKSFADLQGFVQIHQIEEGIAGTEELIKAEMTIGETSNLICS